MDHNAQTDAAAAMDKRGSTTDEHHAWDHANQIATPAPGYAANPQAAYFAVCKQVAADAAAAGIGHDATDEASTTAVRGMIATRCAAAGIDLMDFTTWLHN